MSFNIDKCKIKKVWCGSTPNPPNLKKYSKTGSRVECLRQGFGAGSYSERIKNLPQSSLQRIPYIGPEMESNFHKHNISDANDLLKKMKLTKTPQGKEAVLKNVLLNKNGGLNGKAYNSTIVFLHENGILNLPSCKDI